MTSTPKCMAFSPFENIIAVGFASGSVKLLDVDTLTDLNSFSPTTHEILGLKFSSTGTYFAGFDSLRHVIIFKKMGPSSYEYIGRSLSHSGNIVGIEFCNREGGETLISVGEDRSEAPKCRIIC